MRATKTVQGARWGLEEGGPFRDAETNEHTQNGAIPEMNHWAVPQRRLFAQKVAKDDTELFCRHVVDRGLARDEPQEARQQSKQMHQMWR